MILFQPFNVSGVIEVAVTFDLHHTGVVSPDAFETAVTNRRCVGAPARGDQFVFAVLSNQDAAVNYGNLDARRRSG